MAIAPSGDLPQHALVAASFAENLARESAFQGTDARALFTAFVALVAGRDQKLAAECLMALEGALCANAGSATLSA
jgi:hypothetical protein